MQQLFYAFVKVWVNLSLQIFCKQVIIHNPQQLEAKGPLIIAANHPNSFFDAIIIGANMHQPVHFVTKGNVINKRLDSGRVLVIHIFILKLHNRNKNSHKVIKLCGYSSITFINCGLTFYFSACKILFVNGL